MKSIRPPLLLWLALWLGGSAWCARSLQQEITGAAVAHLAASADQRPAGTRFEARVDGRRVTLQGIAHRESDIKDALHSLSTSLRLDGTLGYGSEINPVSSILSHVELRPKPFGWGVLSATSSTIRLRGTAGSEFESQRIATSIQAAAPDIKSLDNQLVADGEQWVECDHLEDTLRSQLPTMNDSTLRQGMIAIARWGSPWHLLDVDKPVETLRRELVSGGMSDTAWAEGIAADVARVRDARTAWLAALRDAARLAKLPSGHLVLALRADSVLIRGELGTEQSCQLILESLTHTAGSRRVIDELLHSKNRRPEVDVRKLVSTLPALPTGLLAKALAVGSPESGWTSLNPNTIDVLDEASVIAQLKPTGLDPRLVMPDTLAALAWINSINDAPLHNDGVKRLPHLLLAAVGDRVMIRGAVAEEATRTQIETSARKLYLNSTIDSNIRLDAACAPTEGVLHTTTSLPDMPAQNTTGIIAAAIPGETWHVKTLRADLLDAAGLEKSGVVPDGIPVLQIMPDLLDIAGVLKTHIDHVRRTIRGIPLQSPSP